MMIFLPARSEPLHFFLDSKNKLSSEDNNLAGGEKDDKLVVRDTSSCGDEIVSIAISFSDYNNDDEVCDVVVDVRCMS